MRFLARTTIAFASCLAAASCQTAPAVTEPCDLLVRLEPSRATNTIIVANDRKFAQQVAIGRGRFFKYGCDRVRR